MRHLPLAALLALLPVPAGAQTTPAPMLPVDATLLEVSAQGRASRVPDIATIRAGVVTQASSASTALSGNAARMANMLSALRTAGIAERDLSTASVSLQPQYRYADGQPPQLTGYHASNSVSVRFRDVARAGKVLDAMVAQGANQIDGPSLSLDDPNGALDEARADAVKRARARADLYARAAGLHVERILAISEAGEDAGSQPQPVAYRLRAQTAAAPTEILPGQTSVMVTLSVKFVLR